MRSQRNNAAARFNNAVAAQVVDDGDVPEDIEYQEDEPEDDTDIYAQSMPAQYTAAQAKQSGNPYSKIANKMTGILADKKPPARDYPFKPTQSFQKPRSSLDKPDDFKVNSSRQQMRANNPQQQLSDFSR